VFRYSSQGKSRSLLFTRDVRTLRQHHPDWEVLSEVSDDTRLVVSEPVGNLPAAWAEMPEASDGRAAPGVQPRAAGRSALPRDLPRL